MSNTGGPGRELHLPVGGSVRMVCRSSDGREGIPWIVFTNPTHRDVYVAVRTPVNYVKLSLHESGDYRLQWIQKQKDGTRLIKQYRPEPPRDGWVVAASVVTPSDSLHSVKFDPKPMKAKDAVSYWPSPEPFEVLAFHVLIGEQEADPAFLEKGVKPVARIALLGGGEVAVVAEYTSAPGYLKTIAEARNQGQMDEWKVQGGGVLQTNMYHYGQAGDPNGYSRPVINDLGPIIDPARAFRRHS